MYTIKSEYTFFVFSPKGLEFDFIIVPTPKELIYAIEMVTFQKLP